MSQHRPWTPGGHWSLPDYSPPPPSPLTSLPLFFFLISLTSPFYSSPTTAVYLYMHQRQPILLDCTENSVQFSGSFINTKSKICKFFKLLSQLLFIQKYCHQFYYCYFFNSFSVEFKLLYFNNIFLYR